MSDVRTVETFIAESVKVREEFGGDVRFDVERSLAQIDAEPTRVCQTISETQVCDVPPGGEAPEKVAFVTADEADRFNEAIANLAARCPGVEPPDIFSMTLDEVLERSFALLECAEGRCMTPCIVPILLGGALFLSLLAGRDRDGGGTSGLSARLGSASRGFRVAFMGATSGLAGWAASELSGVGFLGSLGGGAASAPLHNLFLASPEFDRDNAKLAIYGAASGLSARGFAETFTEAEGISPTVSRVVGSILGGAVGALATDGFAPEEFRLEES